MTKETAAQRAQRERSAELALERALAVERSTLPPPDAEVGGSRSPVRAADRRPGAGRLAKRDDALRRLDAGGLFALRDEDPASTDGRAIEGIAVPYGVPTRPGATSELGPGIREQFARGSFRQALEALEGRPVPIVDAHDGTVVGVATELEDREEGLWFRGRLLAAQAARDFAERVGAGINGLSVEFAFGETRRRARDLVEHVNVAALGSIAASYRPAYAGAVASVRDAVGGSPVTVCNACGAELEAGVAHVCPNLAPLPAAGPSTAEVGAIARAAATDAVRDFAERMSASGGWSRTVDDPLGDLRAYRSLADLIAAAATPGATTEIRAYAARALADQITANNPGVMGGGILGEVRGIIAQARPAVEAFGRDQLTGAGMTLDFPYFAGNLAALVGVQAAQKTEITSVRVDLLAGTEPIATYAGGSDISYQLIRRSSPSYLEAYGRIMLAAYAVVTDNAFVDRLVALATGVQDIAGTWATRTEAQIRAALVGASVKVATATGSPALFILAAADVYEKIGATLTNLNTLELETTPRIILEPNLAAGLAIASNGTAASWHEDGPLQATDEDVAKLGQNKAYWGLGAAGVYLPAGIVVVSDTTP